MFPGVCLLSLCLLSGLPVEMAILFGPGLIPIIFSKPPLVVESQLFY